MTVLNSLIQTFPVSAITHRCAATHHTIPHYTTLHHTTPQTHIITTHHTDHSAYMHMHRAPAVPTPQP